MKHPCGTCNKWHHIRCSLLDDKTYQYLMQTYDAWYCLNCIKTIYPFATETDEEIKLTLQGKNLSILILYLTKQLKTN